jgi:fumarate reductase flavoprotein subunit
VTIEGGVITDVTVGDNSETQGIGSKAIEQLPALIVEANGIDGVDGVSGASVTSSAIFTAVTDALAQAAA